MEYIVANDGTRIAYYVRGEGTPILFSMGLLVVNRI